MSKQISLTQDKVALVDDSDFDWLSRWKWCALIQVQGRGIYLGLFVSEIEAAKTYDRVARQYFGEFANTNFGASQA